MNNTSTFTQASWQAFAKLHPKLAIKNPVMLVVWVATLLAIVMTGQQISAGESFGFALASSLILFFTLWFANFAEAIAEARGRDQASSLKATRRDLKALKLDGTNEQTISASQLKAGDKVLVNAGELIPADGEIVIGVATINESALTGESAPVLREAGTDHSGVIAGTKVLSGTITVQVTAEAGNSFLDKMISLVEGTNRQKTPNELALTVLLAALTLVFLIAVATLPAMASFVGIELDWLMLIALVVCLIPTTIAGLLPAIGIAGMNRALAANVIAKSGKAVEVAGDIDTLLLDKTGTITFGDRQATAFLTVSGVTENELIAGALWSSLQDPTPEGKSVVRLASELEQDVPQLTGDEEFTPFSAQTRLSAIAKPNGDIWVKGASDAVKGWAQDRGLSVPSGLDSLVTKVAQQGATPLVVASQKGILGVIQLSDVIKPGVAERFAELRALGVRTVMVTGDNPITAGAIAAVAGVDDFVAEAKPEDKLDLIRKEQAQGRLVAMVGDGTNDAPALAQADVGLAMNSGTQAAKEAGNMVDLDSDPTKLLSVVAIGKQMLITRGALTTFSLANDVAKYFVIVPAVFATAMPSIAALNVMQLPDPKIAVLSALIFNALIIPALIPLALKGVKIKAISAEKLLRNNMLIFGLGGIALPFVAIKLIDVLLNGVF
ncbi:MULTISPECIES: potassium-transporting ATPase subunit KdpB [Marinomonas]|uniref:Potassium-transporting ATPase ATP-binding subunit n=1 Tax=Marinomonas arctica TaxID=383750 RepID=A0A7H1J9Y8_9GAMM|nr:MULTISPECIES: potassium-transporting ATPase subunit KdpB [Marinomonas]MCS7488543.1 potassium-transporting ATPase subunit B [Marinomonas sp. BSi20414]QNT07304.1 potassium-transporting ATPase subunit KdpB [Marinomonas arctica]GGN27654.1 potassium-transporting ATPase ATP-binding subunit [Marinomonas arctica]